MVGWQITIMKDDRVVQHSKVARDLNAALIDAYAYIDTLGLPPEASQTQ